LAKAGLNMRAGSTMAIYWSAVTTFAPITEPTVAVISAPVDLVRSTMGWISRSSTPAFSTTPPKASAVMTSQMVLSMLSMPPRETSWSMARLPVSVL